MIICGYIIYWIFIYIFYRIFVYFHVNLKSRGYILLNSSLEHVVYVPLAAWSFGTFYFIILFFSFFKFLFYSCPAPPLPAPFFPSSPLLSSLDRFYSRNGIHCFVICIFTCWNRHYRIKTCQLPPNLGRNHSHYYLCLHYLVFSLVSSFLHSSPHLPLSLSNLLVFLISPFFPSPLPFPPASSPPLPSLFHRDYHSLQYQETPP